MKIVNGLYDIREQQKKTSTEYAAPDISATNTCISTIFLVTRAFLPDLKKYQWCLYFFSLEMLDQKNGGNLGISCSFRTY